MKLGKFGVFWLKDERRVVLQRITMVEGIWNSKKIMITIDDNVHSIIFIRHKLSWKLNFKLIIKNKENYYNSK